MKRYITANSVEEYTTAPNKYNAISLANYLPQSITGMNEIMLLGEFGVPITKLTLHVRALDGNGADVAKDLSNFISKSITLKEIEFINSPLDNSFVEGISEAIGKSQTLISVAFDRCNIDDVSAVYLAKGLKVNKNIKQLKITGNQIGDVGAIALAKSLKENKELGALHLNNNTIRDQGAEAIAELAKSPNIQNISLHNNQIGDVGAESLAAALKGGAKFFLVIDKNYLTGKGEALLEDFMKVDCFLKPQHPISLKEEFLKAKQQDEVGKVESLKIETSEIAELKAKLAAMENELLKAKQETIKITEEKTALSEQLKIYQKQPVMTVSLEEASSLFEEAIKNLEDIKNEYTLDIQTVGNHPEVNTAESN
jgi:Leucine-rich repeat (LRR) protein